jgi:hypothetical protein
VIARDTARAVSTVLDPVIWVPVIAIATGWHVDGIAGIGWGLLGVVFAAVLPEAFIWCGLRRGHWTDWQLPVRYQRLTVMAFAMGSVAAGIGLLVGLGAPWPITAAILVMLITVATLAIITIAWKISIHCATAAGSALVLVVLFGVAAVPVYLLVLLTGWSRFVLRAHSMAQIIAGVALGSGCALLYLVLR